MKLKLPHLFVLMLAISLTSCNSDDTTSISEENTNSFTFNNETYIVISAIVNDDDSNTNEASEVEIRLFNKTTSEITSNTDLEDISFVYFKISATNLQETTYTQFADYTVSVNASVENSTFNFGTILLSAEDAEADVYAQSGSVTVTNFTTFNLDFSFTFTRNDGEIITGRYNGNYLQFGSND